MKEISYNKTIVVCLMFMAFFPVRDFKFTKIDRFVGPLVARSLNHLPYNIVGLSGLVKTYAKYKFCKYDFFMIRPL